MRFACSTVEPGIHKKAITECSRAFLWCTGAIPASIGNLTNLQVLNLSDNVQYPYTEYGYQYRYSDKFRPIAGTGLSGALVESHQHKKGHHGTFPRIPVMHRCHPGFNRQSHRPQ